VTRRIHEELGCEARDLRELFAFRYFARYRDVGVEFEHCHVWLGRINSADVVPNPDEIDAVAYLSPEILTKSLQAGPEFYTPWFHLAWPMVLPHLL
jgi:isopentenyl-diphosphate delta-isomerase